MREFFLFETSGFIDCIGVYIVNGIKRKVNQSGSMSKVG